MSTTTFSAAGLLQTVEASGALSQGQRVVLSAPASINDPYVATAAGLTDKADAIVENDIADGEIGTVARLSFGYSYTVLADANGHAADATVYGAAGGVASDTQGVGAFQEGIAMQAAGADELFEMIYKPAFTAGE